jgi:hypothetical protein
MNRTAKAQFIMNIVTSTWKNSRLDILVVIGLALLTSAVYWQSAQHGFIRYDDPTYVTENLVVQRGLSWDGLVWAFTTATAATGTLSRGCPT